MEKTRRNNYEVILQQNNGYGWDDVETFETNSSFALGKGDRDELKRLKDEYRIAQPSAALRTIHRATRTQT